LSSVGRAQIPKGPALLLRSTNSRPLAACRVDKVTTFELAAITSKLGHIPTVAEYHEAMKRD
jgi:aconitase B